MGDLLAWLFRAAAAGREGDPTTWRGGPEAAAPLAAALDLHRGWTLLARRTHLVDGLPEAAAERAVQVRRRAAGHQLAVEADLQTCAAALDAAGLPWACVKGPVLDARYRRTGDSRASLDLDLLVGPGDFVTALRVLGSTGTALLDRNWELLRSAVPGEVALRAPRGTTVDLHWSLLNKASRRGRTALVTEDLLAGAVRVEVGGQLVSTLEPAHTLAHLCLHAAGSGADRLQWLLDVALTARDPALDWGSVVAVAQGWGTAVPVGLVLERSRRHLGAPVPRPVVRQLLGRGGWGVVDRAVGAASGRHGTQERRAVRLVGIGAVDHGSLAQWVLRRGLRSRGGERRAPFVQNAHDPGSALHPSGTEADLSAYLAAVTAEAVR